MNSSRVTANRGTLGVILYLASVAAQVLNSPGKAEESLLPPPSHLVSWWTGDNTTADLNGVADGFIVGNVQYAAGIVGQAFDLQGGHISVPDHPALRLSTSYTVEMWINPRDLDNRPVLFSKSLNKFNRVGFEVFETGRLCGYFDNAGCVISDSDLVMTGEWSHVALVFDDFENEQLIYYNGSLVQQLSELRSPSGNLANIAIGQSELYTQFAFDGLIDEVSVYSRRLSGDEIFAIYSAGSSGKCKDPQPLPSCELIPDGAVTLWSGDQNLEDSVSGFDGNGYGMGYSNALVGDGFRLNGGGDRIEVTHVPELGLNSSFTFECWVAPDSVGNGPVIFEKGTDVLHRFGFQIGTSGLLCAYFDAGYCSAFSDYGTVTPGIFTHVALVFDDSADTLRLYKNGILVGEGTDPRTPSLNPTAPLVIGNSNIVPTIAFSGVLDEISVYDRPLSSEELLAIYLAGSQGKCLEVNLLPIASAGDDQIIRAGGIATLDGSASSDDQTLPENLEYVWSLESVPAGSLAMLSDASVPSPDLITDVPGLYLVSLVVIDEQGLSSDSDTVLVDASNLAPTAVAGSDFMAVLGETITLDGTQSWDPEDDELFYSWSIVSNPVANSAILATPEEPTTEFIPDTTGVYEFGLAVSDFLGEGTPDSLTVHVLSPEEVVLTILIDVENAVGALGLRQVRNKGNQNALRNFIRQAIVALEARDLDEARLKIQQSIIRVDGCSLRGRPDGNGSGRDWVVDCGAQELLFSALNQAAALLAGL